MEKWLSLKCPEWMTDWVQIQRYRKMMTIMLFPLWRNSRFDPTLWQTGQKNSPTPSQIPFHALHKFSYTSLSPHIIPFSSWLSYLGLWWFSFYACKDSPLSSHFTYDVQLYSSTWSNLLPYRAELTHHRKIESFVWAEWFCIWWITLVIIGLLLGIPVWDGFGSLVMVGMLSPQDSVQCSDI